MKEYCLIATSCEHGKKWEVFYFSGVLVIEVDMSYVKNKDACDRF